MVFLNLMFSSRASRQKILLEWGKKSYKISFFTLCGIFFGRCQMPNEHFTLPSFIKYNIKTAAIFDLADGPIVRMISTRMSDKNRVHPQVSRLPGSLSQYCFPGSFFRVTLRPCIGCAHRRRITTQY